MLCSARGGMSGQDMEAEGDGRERRSTLAQWNMSQAEASHPVSSKQSWMSTKRLPEILLREHMFCLPH